MNEAIYFCVKTPLGYVSEAKVTKTGISCSVEPSITSALSFDNDSVPSVMVASLSELGQAAELVEWRMQIIDAERPAPAAPTQGSEDAPRTPRAAPKAKSQRKAGPETKTPEKASEAAAPPVQTETQGGPPPKRPAVTAADVQIALKAYAKAKGSREAVLALLAKFGGKTVADVDPKKYPALLAEIGVA